MTGFSVFVPSPIQYQGYSLIAINKSTFEAAILIYVYICMFLTLNKTIVASLVWPLFGYTMIQSKKCCVMLNE